VGDRGLLPVGQFLSRLHAAYGAEAYRLWPTLVWLSPGDACLSILSWAGAFTSLLLVAGIAPVATAAVLWVLYLSLTVAGQVFLQFQWDALLLETGLLAILYAPLCWRSRLGGGPEPPAMVRWVLWGLAFKLTYLSGVTKMLSGDATWANWTALGYHYETQPIPAWTSWYMHRLPQTLHYWSAGVMLMIEMGVSWLSLAPPRFRRVRLVACSLMVLLQVGIAATGNYGFFNVLTIVLYLALLDDRTLLPFLPARSALSERQVERAGGPVLWRVTVNVVALAIGCLSVLTIGREIDRTRGQRGALSGAWSEGILAWVSPLESINGYGLFRVMTTERPEIVIEVSEDGAAWKEYEFQWKAGDVGRRPRFVEPHMPRLDWQMWFAALDPRSAQDWLEPLLQRVLEGDVAVTRLMGPGPMVGRARYARLTYYRYRFTTGAERASTGAWWRREFVGYLTDPIAAAGLSRAP
jgi:hypothetical protein